MRDAIEVGDLAIAQVGLAERGAGDRLTVHGRFIVDVWSQAYDIVFDGRIRRLHDLQVDHGLDELMRGLLDSTNWDGENGFGECQGQMWAARRRLERRITSSNLVVNTGKNLILDNFNAATGAAVYVGLTGHTPTIAAGDTMASHAGWTEVTAYSQANRVTWNGAAASSQSRTNSASKASFTINSDSTNIGGAFMTTNNTKGGSTGTLVCAAALSGGNITLNNTAALDITYVISIS